jgi:hypothetical protein
MNVKRFGLAALATLLVTACSNQDAGPFTAVIPPLAYTRFVNAVPDTGAIDFRFVDAVEYSPFATALAFRSFTPYQGTAPGARHMRTFPNSTDITVTSQIMKDATLTFEAGKYYTIAFVGNSRAGATNPADLVVMEDATPDPGASIAVRVVNFGTDLSNVDVYAAASTGAALPGTPSYTNVAYRAASSWVTMTPGTLALKVTDAGTTTPLRANVAAPAGAPKGTTVDPDANPIGGAAQPGSAFTAFFMPRSVAGSKAPQSSAFTNPTIVYIVDKSPAQ